MRDVGGGWKQYRVALHADKQRPLRTAGASRSIAPGRSGSTWCRLFPRDTFKKRPNGLRPDLAQTLADLKPAFVRFPGGAIVGGLNLDNRIQWKNSIGPIDRSARAR